MNDGKNAVEEFGKLCAETVIAYKLFASLFEVDQSQLELYSSIAPYCFGDLNNILHQYVILNSPSSQTPLKPDGTTISLRTTFLRRSHGPKTYACD